MSDKLKKLNRPFSKKIVNAAKKIAEKYGVILSSENGEWYGRGLEMPNVFGYGKTAQKCVDNTREGLVSAVAHLMELGEVIPVPASVGNRTEQVNIRLTVEEKAILGASAKSKGFKGLADFIRAKALTPQR